MDQAIPFSASDPLTHMYPPDAGYFVYSRNTFQKYINDNVGSADCASTLLRWAGCVMRQHPNSGFEGRILLNPGLCDLIMSSIIADSDDLARAFRLPLRTAYMIDVEAVLPLLESYARHEEEGGEGGQELITVVRQAAVNEAAAGALMKRVHGLTHDAAELFALARCYEASRRKPVVERIVRMWHSQLRNDAGIKDDGIRKVMNGLESNSVAMKSLYGGATPKMTWFRDLVSKDPDITCGNCHAYTVAVAARAVPMHQAKALALASHGARRLDGAAEQVARASAGGARAPQAVEAFYTRVPSVPAPPSAAQNVPATVAQPPPPPPPGAAGRIEKWEATNTQVPVPLQRANPPYIYVGAKYHSYPYYNPRREYTSPDTGQKFYFAGPVQALRQATMPGVPGSSPNDIAAGRDAVVKRMEKTLDGVTVLKTAMSEVDNDSFTGVGTGKVTVPMFIEVLLKEKKRELEITGINTQALNDHIYSILQQTTDGGDQVYEYFDRIVLSGRSVSTGIVGSAGVVYTENTNKRGVRIANEPAFSALGATAQPPPTYTAINDARDPLKANVFYLIDGSVYKLQPNGIKLQRVTKGSADWNAFWNNRNSSTAGMMPTGESGDEDDFLLVSKAENDRKLKLDAKSALVFDVNEDVVDKLEEGEIYRDSTDCYVFKPPGEDFAYRLIIEPSEPASLIDPELEVYQRLSVSLYAMSTENYGNSYEEWHKMAEKNEWSEKLNVDVDQDMYYLGKIGKRAEDKDGFIGKVIGYYNPMDIRFIWENSRGEKFGIYSENPELKVFPGDIPVSEFLIQSQKTRLDTDYTSKLETTGAKDTDYIRPVQISDTNHGSKLALSNFTLADAPTKEDIQNRIQILENEERLGSASVEIDPASIKNRAYEYIDAQEERARPEHMYPLTRAVCVVLQSETNPSKFNVYRITTEKFDAKMFSGGKNEEFFNSALECLRKHGAWGIPMKVDSDFDAITSYLSLSKTNGVLRSLKLPNDITFTAKYSVDNVVGMFMKHIRTLRPSFTSLFTKDLRKHRIVILNNGMCMVIDATTNKVVKDRFTKQPEMFTFENWALSNFYQFKSPGIYDLEICGKKSEITTTLGAAVSSGKNHVILYNKGKIKKHGIAVSEKGGVFLLRPNSLQTSSKRNQAKIIRDIEPLAKYDTKLGREQIKNLLLRCKFGAVKQQNKKNEKDLTILDSDAPISSADEYALAITSGEAVVVNTKGESVSDREKILAMYKDKQPQWYGDDSFDGVDFEAGAYDKLLNNLNSEQRFYLYEDDDNTYYSTKTGLASIRGYSIFSYDKENVVSDPSKLAKFHTNILASLLTTGDSTMLSQDIYSKFNGLPPSKLLSEDLLDAIGKTVKGTGDAISDARVENNAITYSVGPVRYSVKPMDASPVAAEISGNKQVPSDDALAPPVAHDFVDKTYLDANGYAPAKIRPAVGQFVYLLPKGRSNEYAGGTVTAVRGNHIYIDSGHSCNGFKKNKVYVVEEAEEVEVPDVFTKDGDGGVDQDPGKVYLCPMNRQVWVSANAGGWISVDLSRGVDEKILEENKTEYTKGQATPPFDDININEMPLEDVDLSVDNALISQLLASNNESIQAFLQNERAEASKQARRVNIPLYTLCEAVDATRASKEDVKYVFGATEDGENVYSKVSFAHTVSEIGNVVDMYEWQQTHGLLTWSVAVNSVGNKLVDDNDAFKNPSKLTRLLDGASSCTDAAADNFDVNTVYYTGLPDKVFFAKRSTKTGQIELRRIKYTPGRLTTHGRYDMSKAGSVVKLYSYMGDPKSAEMGGDNTVANRIAAMNVIIAQSEITDA